MALQKSVTAATGITSPAAYYKVEELAFSVRAGLGTAVILGYNTVDDVGKMPVDRITISASGADLAAILTASLSEAEKLLSPLSIILRRTYVYAKSQPTFTNSIDV